MKLVSCHLHQLQVDAGRELSSRENGFVTGYSILDQLVPDGGFAWGAIHEVLWEADGVMPWFFATVLARGAMQEREKVAWVPSPVLGRAAWAGRPSHGPEPVGSAAQTRASMPLRCILWSDPHGLLYPPALAAAGIGPEELLLLRPRTCEEELWAVVQGLRCVGVAATVANVPHLSRVEARRLQLAAEAGGNAGILLREHGAGSREYAAATRWLVRPAGGLRTVQRWKVELIHGHGGRIGQSVILEVCRETNLVRVSEAVVDRSVSKRAWA